MENKIEDKKTETPNVQIDNDIFQDDKDAEAALAASLIRPDDLSSKQLEEYNVKYRLIKKVENGVSPSDALSDSEEKLKFLKIKGSVRWVNKLRHKFRLNGVYGLLDRRINNKSERKLFTSEVESRVLAHWYAYPAAGAKAVWELTRDQCQKDNIACPGYDSVKKFLKNQPEHHKLVRAGKIRTWDKQGRSVVRVENTTRANERWQADHTHLDTWIREKIDGRWVASEVHLSVFMDAHTRAITGIWLSKRYPDAWTILMLLRWSILPKKHKNWLMQGIPHIIQPDRGADWMSNTVALSVGYLGINYDPDPPYYPNSKGKIERWFETLDIGLLRKLPGHKLAIGKSRVSAEKHIAKLLELHELRDEIIKYILETHHEREHSTTKKKPAQHWLESADLRMPESEKALNEMLLKSDKNRKVRNIGVDFTYDGHRGHYWSNQISNYLGQEVQLRYNPEDLKSILLYSVDKNEFLCEAFLMGQEDSPFTIEDVKRERNQTRAGLLARQSLYAKKAEEFDRPRREQKQKEKTQALLAAKTNDLPPKKADTSQKAYSLLERLERRDRGEQ